MTYSFYLFLYTFVCGLLLDVFFLAACAVSKICLMALVRAH